MDTLQERVLAMIAGDSSERFDDLALEVFAFQYEHNPHYRAYCDRQPKVRHWKDIPAVPTTAFKDFEMTCFPVEQAVAEFHTSGTTGAKPGKPFFKPFELYDTAIRPNFAAHLQPDGAQLPMQILTPSPEEAPHSSLSHMMGVVAVGETEFYVRDGTLEIERLVRDLCEIQWAHQPVLLLGTAFAFVHLFDHCAKENLRFELAEGSRAMETGGFKGRAREMTKNELYARFERVLGIPPARVVNEYGMTELSTQFYDETLQIGHQSDLKLVPPWARVLVIDPNTGREAAINERGLIRVYDPANLWSIMCVQTEDLGILRGEGKFEVLGRAAGTEVRGCSLTAEAFSTK